MTAENKSGKDRNDAIVRHFILISLILYEVFDKLLMLIISALQSSKGINPQSGESERLKPKRTEQALSKKIVDQHSEQELIEIIYNKNVINALSKEILSDFVLANGKAIEELNKRSREKELTKLTNEQLREILDNTSSIRRLRKSELISTILEKEF